MKLIRLSMGCLSSKSTISPSERVEPTTHQRNNISTRRINNQNNYPMANDDLRANKRNRDNNTAIQENAFKISSNSDQGNIDQQTMTSLIQLPNDDIISVLMEDQEKLSGTGQENDELKKINKDEAFNSIMKSTKGELGDIRKLKLAKSSNNSSRQSIEREIDQSVILDTKKSAAKGSFDEDLNMDLLRQYLAVDYEITHLEDKDALRVYHEKIEQLEQLERELDMISSEAEEIAVRSETDNHLERLLSPSVTGGPQMDSKIDIESNSVLSGVTGSISHRSWMISEQRSAPNRQRNKSDPRTQSIKDSQITDNGRFNNISYSTVEEVFNRKIILEKKRDKLKKEVEMVIVECDKLQQRYKKRDEILDKLFDGRTGNGLENHLEQQLNWLLEQKQYVDQVFYAWKRAETLTSQTCAQFANALELLKRLPKIQEPNQRLELSKSIESLLLKSRQDMEQAQKYNPNVDAPFFTDNETERFDKIIKTISSNSINSNEYSQILTVIQFAYKRAVSIRLWLEQILQTTIARDSFELAEEYKWIAIQLRKERINMIKSKLQDSPYHSMAIQEQMASKQSLVERGQHEINRDSGVESETNDIDIEEEIYRLLELNKSRLETAAAPSGGNISLNEQNLRQNQNQKHIQSNQQQQHQQQQLEVSQNPAVSSSSSSESQRDQLIRDRIQRRVKSDQPLLSTNTPDKVTAVMASPGAQNKQESNDDSAHVSEASNNSVGNSPTPTKLKIELNEEARQSLLKQVDQIHLRHKSRIERLRGSNRAKATDSIMNRMQQARKQSQKQTEIEDETTARSN